MIFQLTIVSVMKKKKKKRYSRLIQEHQRAIILFEILFETFFNPQALHLSQRVSCFILEVTRKMLSVFFQVISQYFLRQSALSSQSSFAIISRAKRGLRSNFSTLRCKV